MQIIKQYSNKVFLSLFVMLTVFVIGCNDDSESIQATETLTPPIVLSTTPLFNDSNITLNTDIVAFFDKELDSSTVNTTTFILENDADATVIDGSVSYANNTMIFNPTTNLDANTTYNATITTGVKDLAGSALEAEYLWSFTTGAITDDTAPTVISVDPFSSETEVAINTSISALFSETLDPSTVNLATFTLNQSGENITGEVSYEDKRMIFKPTENLLTNTTYSVTITTGVKDLASNALASAETWSFTTGEAEVSILAPVDLGTAKSFVILAKTGISTTGETAITGDIGVSPAALSYLTGFSETLMGTYALSPLVSGKIYAANMDSPTPTKMTTAVSDIQTAYTDAAGRSLPDHTEHGAGDVSGMTLAPGLYKWGTGLLITNAGVTLSGSATDVWIFQISGDLTVDNGAIITLAGGALAKNIFWQVAGGTGVSLGTTAQFKGIILAEKGINVNTGATVDGRLLSQTAVTLDANAITQP